MEGQARGQEAVIRVRRRLLTPFLAVALVGLPFLAAPVQAKGSLSRVEDEFEKAIRRVTPATVVCLPWGVPRKQIIGGSSGVIVSRKGLVLSDGDVGIYIDPPAGKKPSREHMKWSDLVEIRLPSLKGKGFSSYKAKVIKRDRDLDTTLMRIEKPPSGLKYVKPGRSDDLRVGDFTFAVGNSFGLAAEAPPTLTAGVVASLVPQPETAGGRWSYIYTSAAVNPGVNGGPLVDIDGRLVGTISNVVSLTGSGKKPDDPELAYAYLGKVIPVARLKKHYAGLSEYGELFPDADASKRRGESSALAAVFHHTARRAAKAVVSLEIKRKGQMSLAEPGGRGTVNIPRYLGPVSGVLISEDGYVLTSLYNLTNIATLVHGQRWRNPPDNVKVQAGLDSIEGLTVYLPDARTVPGKIVGRHEGIGIALIKADLTDSGTAAGGGVALLEHADPKDMRAGRFTLVVGNPFGANRLDDPLLTVGVLSKQHADETASPWASQWQTDAGITDANCGGAAVDIHGHLLGIATVWSSTMHGRNSGIGFVVPWSQIEPVLEELKAGRTFRAPFFGITWKQLGTTVTTVLATVLEGKAAAKAGLKPGDEIVKINGKPVKTPGEVRALLRGKWSGDTLQLTIRRAGEEQELKLVLGARE